MKLKHFLLLAVFTVSIAACKDETSNKNNSEDSDTTNITVNETSSAKENNAKQEQIDSLNFSAGQNAFKVADSIMYITNVINADPEASYYMDQWLGGADTKLLADKIFDAVYGKRLKAYDYMTGEEMSIDDVKALEKEYKRKDIGQILFTENWFFDEKELKMYKQVNSVMLAYFRYDDNGNLIGNKAGIRVYFNGTKPMRGAMDY